MTRHLQEGDELLCPHCGRWHPVISKHRAGTEYAMNMLYWTCRRSDYYAGQIGVPFSTEDLRNCRRSVWPPEGSDANHARWTLQMAVGTIALKLDLRAQLGRDSAYRHLGATHVRDMLYFCVRWHGLTAVQRYAEMSEC